MGIGWLGVLLGTYVVTRNPGIDEKYSTFILNLRHPYTYYMKK
jgi:hypothetical protein